MKIPLGLLLVCCIPTLVPASAEPIYEFVRKWENPRGVVDGIGDEFGISISVAGENLLVGAYKEGTGADGAGAAYLFDPRGNLLTTFHNPNPQEDAMYGFDVGGFGDKLIIAARRDSRQANDSGVVHLYDSDGTLIQTIVNPTPASGDEFGSAITWVGNNVLATSWTDDTKGENAGAAYLYNQQGELLRSIFSPNAAESARFGRRVTSLSDDKFVISSAENAGGSFQSGAVYIYDTDGGEPLRIPNPEPFRLDLFGNDLSLVGEDMLLVGALQDDTATGISAGAAYLFDLNGSLLQKFDNPTPSQLDWFGRSVAGVTKDTLIIGAEFDDTLGDGPGANTGAAYLFSTDGELLQTFLPPEPAASGHFGSDFAVINDRLFIASHFDGGRFTGAGAVYEYRLVPEPSTWLMLSVGAMMLVIGRRQLRCRG